MGAESGDAVARLSDVERRFIETQRVGRLATVDHWGEPFVVPVCYAHAYDGARFYTPIDEKPKQRDRPLKRVRNIQETGRAALVIDRYDDADWSRLAWVLIRGRAAIMQPDDPEHAEAVSLMRARYPQYATMALEVALVITLTPEHIRSWGALEGKGGNR